MPPTILVTGANGFIGQPLCAALVKRHYKVKASVRSTAKCRVLHPKVEPFVGDVELSHLDVWRGALQDVDTLIHLAACVHHRDKAGDQPFQRVNTRGTSRLCRLAVECGIRRFIFLSTVKVNGETSPRSLSENDPPLAQGPYAISKMKAEQRIKTITRGSGCEYVIIRPPLVYGPQVKANFYSLLKLISAGIPLPMGSLHNRRSMIYVGNLVDVILCAMENPYAAGQVFMVSDGQDPSVAQLMRAIAKAMGHKPKMFPFPPVVLHWLFTMIGKGEVIDKLCQPLTVDTSKIRDRLGWRPPFSVSQGLADTVDWFRNSNPSG